MILAKGEKLRSTYITVVVSCREKVVNDLLRLAWGFEFAGLEKLAWAVECMFLLRLLLLYFLLLALDSSSFSPSPLHKTRS